MEVGPLELGLDQEGSKRIGVSKVPSTEVNPFDQISIVSAPPVHGLGRDVCLPEACKGAVADDREDLWRPCAIICESGIIGANTVE